MRNPKPMFGAVLVIALLFTVITAAFNRAHAEPTGMQLSCEAVMPASLGETFDMLPHGLPIVRHLVRTDPTLGGAGRWMLLRTLEAHETASAFGQPLTRSQFIAFGLALCAVQPPPQVPATGRPMWQAPPQEI